VITVFNLFVSLLLGLAIAISSTSNLATLFATDHISRTAALRAVALTTGQAKLAAMFCR
jgi:hypothetical protein